ncbi:glycoside hydrolase family 6 protein [Streptomyces sp. NPDC060194]|uniref:glycoside hydrolase family 6 protein n=1 Tax=Streptomyces sp. NPDC060194 TaxID=3347069 RepID=UPI0036611D93
MPRPHPRRRLLNSVARRCTLAAATAAALGTAVAVSAPPAVQLPPSATQSVSFTATDPAHHSGHPHHGHHDDGHHGHDQHGGHGQPGHGQSDHGTPPPEPSGEPTPPEAIPLPPWAPPTDTGDDPGTDWGTGPIVDPGTEPGPDPETGGGESSEFTLTELFRPPSAKVLDWIAANPDDPRRAAIEAELAHQPAAMWFTEYNPGRITADVRAITSAAAEAEQVPVLVVYAIPNRDCGGHSRGGAPDLAAYNAWVRDFAAGLGDSEAVVILEPDSLALADCLPEGDRQARYTALAEAARTLKAANPEARVYLDGGHSGWHPAEQQAAALRASGVTEADGVYSNVANFHTTEDETAYTRAILDALGDPDLGAVIDTSRNGNGAPAAGQWCDPQGRALGQPPTLTTGEDRIDAYLWIKLPGESDGCLGKPGDFVPDYAASLVNND